MSHIKNNQYRARQVRLLLKIIIVFDVLIVIFDLKEYSLLSNLENSMLISAYEAVANDTRQALVGIFYFITALCSGIAFLNWFYRAYCNLERGGIKTKYPTSYAIFSFFIPVYNFFLPYRIMCEIWNNITLIDNIDGSGMKSSGIKSLNWWWILWLASISTAVLYFYAVITAENIFDMEKASIFNIVSSLVDIPAAIVTISLVGKVSKFEKQWFITNTRSTNVT